MIAAAEELSVKSTGVGKFIPISSSSCFSHTISHVVYASARYSASVDDLAIACCFFVCHDIRFSLRNMANSIVERRMVGHEAQSEFEKSLMPEVFDPELKKRPRYGESFKYLRILFTFLVSSCVGLDMC